MTYFNAHFKAINNKGNKDYQNKIKIKQKTKEAVKTEHYRHLRNITYAYLQKECLTYNVQNNRKQS